MNKKISFIVTLIILFGAMTGFCNDYYVDAARDTSDPTCDGTIENPWTTITKALSLVEGTESDPAVIYIAAGRYDLASGESFPLNLKSNVSIKGADKETTTISSTGIEAVSVILCLGVKNIRISGFTITGGSGSMENTGC
jgi:hypothetical protein